MEVVTQALPKSGNASIYLAGDFHYGALTCSRSSIKQMVTAIAGEKDALLILMGDLIEAITPDDRRWQTTSVACRVCPATQPKSFATFGRQV